MCAILLEYIGVLENVQQTNNTGQCICKMLLIEGYVQVMCLYSFRSSGYQHIYIQQYWQWQKGNSPTAVIFVLPR